MKRLVVLVGSVLAALLVAGAVRSSGDAQAVPRQASPPPPAKLNTKLRNRLVLTTGAYKLTLSKINGALLELVDRRTGARVLRGQAGCGWALTAAGGHTVGGCDFTPRGDNRFSYRWAPRASRLTLRYDGAEVSARLTVTAAPQILDLRLTLEHDFDRPAVAVLFPADLASEVATTRGVYTPTFLPGIRLLPEFFATPRRNVERYPSRWAFADYLAADVGRSHVAVYSVNPAPAPVAPVDIGVIKEEAGACGGGSYCFTHVFQTWLTSDEEWSSPLLRVRVGGSVEQSILGYREENGIGDYPSLQTKLGARLDTLAQAPLVKIDPWKGLPRFDDWARYLERLPSPSLLHPVAFQQGGHDESYPDFLPPDPRWGSLGELNHTFLQARALGHLVMPYLNVSWWDTQSPSVRELPAGLTARDIAMQTTSGEAVTEQFGDKDGYITSPYAPYVRDRIARLMEEWQTDVPVECLFFDQIGARPWRRDFNPAAPSPIAYADGWLETFADYRDRCVMTEDGWDRLADAFVGFHGGVLQMQREHDWPDDRWGAGNWEPYPLALWLLHDKVLLYQHDLYPNTLAFDAEVLLYDVAFGMVASTTWNGETGSLDTPWPAIAGAVQRAVGPSVVGQPLTAYRLLAEDVTESEFDGTKVVANWSSENAFELDGYRIAPLGFLARDADGRLLAGVLGDSWAGVTIPADD